MTIIGIAGGSGSGKTTFALLLQELMGRDRCAILHQDAYYHDLSHAFDRAGGSINFDHPDAIDFALLGSHLQELASGRPVEVPVYDYATHRRLPRTHPLAAGPVLVVEGMLVLSRHSVRAHLDVKVFIEATEQVRLARRLARDVRERGRDPAGIERQFLTQVKPMHDRFVEPSRWHADTIYSGEGEFQAQIHDLLTSLGSRLR